MKTLYLIRHAKSSWDNPGQDDVDRPLNERGKKDAPRMGKRLKEREIYPQMIISSHAKRALSTAKRIAKAIGHKKDDIIIENHLYHASEDAIMKIIQRLKDDVNVVFLVGHNPGLTDFINSLRQDDDVLDNLPTCGIIGFRFNIDSWKDIAWESGELLFYDFPKSKED